MILRDLYLLSCRTIKEDQFIMKLKKIASLALAGAMAVSMLAGCATKGTETGNNGTATTTTSIVDAVNNGQSANNKVKVTFTDNASLDAALEKAVSMTGESIWTNVGVDQIEKLTGIKVHSVDSQANVVGLLTNYKAGDVKRLLDSKRVKDGETFTAINVGEVSALNADAAQKLVAAGVDEVLGELYTTTHKDGMSKDDKYFNYSYTGNVAMTSKVDSNGMTHYYYAVVLNQTVAVETVKGL